MEAASFYGMKWNKRYSVQPDRTETIVEVGICPNKIYYLKFKLGFLFLNLYYNHQLILQQHVLISLLRLWNHSVNDRRK